MQTLLTLFEKDSDVRSVSRRGSLELSGIHVNDKYRVNLALVEISHRDLDIAVRVFSERWYRKLFSSSDSTGLTTSATIVLGMGIYLSVGSKGANGPVGFCLACWRPMLWLRLPNRSLVQLLQPLLCRNHILWYSVTDDILSRTFDKSISSLSDEPNESTVSF
jgi:hypothetical protein